MAKLVRLTQEQRDNLVAYLDGELDEVATQEIEQVLSVSEVARHEVDMLSRSWDMLAVLPVHKVSSEFTQKTVSMLRAAEQPRGSFPSEAFYRQARRGAVLGLWGAILAACGYLGFAATNRWVPNSSDQLIEDYEIINNFNKYREAMSPQDSPTAFLEVLNAKRTFAERDDHAAK